jgi:hypothetical protein
MDTSPEIPETSESKKIIQPLLVDEPVIFCTYGHDGFCIQKKINDLKK